MANVTLNSTYFELAFVEFPGNRAILNMTSQWTPQDRLDVRRQKGRLKDRIAPGHSLWSNVVQLRNFARSAFETVFTGRGRSIVASPVSQLTIGWQVVHAIDLATSGVEANVTVVWRPDEYPKARSDIEVSSKLVAPGDSLIDDFQVLADHAVTMFRTEYSEHTVTGVRSAENIGRARAAAGKKTRS